MAVSSTTSAYATSVPLSIRKRLGRLSVCLPTTGRGFSTSFLLSIIVRLLMKNDSLVGIGLIAGAAFFGGISQNTHKKIYLKLSERQKKPSSLQHIHVATFILSRPCYLFVPDKGARERENSPPSHEVVLSKDPQIARLVQGSLDQPHSIPHGSPPHRVRQVRVVSKLCFRMAEISLIQEGARTQLQA